MVKTNCCVPGCDQKGLKRFRFPNPNGHLADELYHAWIWNVNNPDLFCRKRSEIYKNVRICEKHFNKEKYIASCNLFFDAIPLFNLNRKDEDLIFVEAFQSTPSTINIENLLDNSTIPIETENTAETGDEFIKSLESSINVENLLDHATIPYEIEITADTDDGLKLIKSFESTLNIENLLDNSTIPLKIENTVDTGDELTFIKSFESTPSTVNVETVLNTPIIPFETEKNTAYTGYRTNKSNKKLSMFCAPKNPLDFELWQKSIPRKDKILTSKDVLCERHFKPGEIIREWKSGDITIPYQRPRLKPGAVPTVFPLINTNSKLSENYKLKRRKKISKKEKIELKVQIKQRQKQIEEG